MNNSLMMIYPRMDRGMWIFDDDTVGLVKEPFVAGVPAILESLLAKEKILHPESGFRLIFSATPFPGHQLVAVQLREEDGGHWYGVDPNEGWLCPAMFNYFSQAPDNLYVRVEALDDPRLFATTIDKGKVEP